MIRAAALLLAVLLAAPMAEAAACWTDRLGNTTCVGAAEQPALRIPHPFGRPADPEPPAFIPSWRRDAFGTIRPQRPPVTGGAPFGTPPRPEPRARCTADSFGNLSCR